MKKEEMTIKKYQIIIGFLIFAIFLTFLSSNVFGVGESLLCCEKTTNGAWCQNSPPASCNINFRTVPTSCEATSFCKLGTCMDSSEGTCLPNTPQSVCQQDGGVWDERDANEITQCQLGCCILGDEAAFVTQTACKRISSDYGLSTNFRTDINDEISCIAAAGADAKGACVFEEEFQRTCKMETKSECQDREASLGTNANVEFHEGFLCSAESLATNCGPSKQTTCVLNKDEVYFLDTCGNIANIYNSNEIENKEYWTTIYEKEESCNVFGDNANSADCGNCEYLLGSTCKAYERGGTAKPNYGNYICKDLACEWKGERYEHGEKWCTTSTQTNKGENLPGTEHYRLACYNGEVTVEQCDSFRNQYCAETTIELENDEEFSYAACKVNIWSDCAIQDNAEDCEDIEARDCQWIEGHTNALFIDDEGKRYVVNKDGELVPESESDSEKRASCIPIYAPGFSFWEEDTNAEEWCSIGNDYCIVKYEKGIIGEWKCVENCECIGDKKEAAILKIEANSKWVEVRNEFCSSLGDCGSKVNYIGTEGYENGDIISIESAD